MDNQSVKLFWTGGWDSTFRLLELLLIDNKRVEPIYVIDPNRVSLGSELQAMRNIRKALFSHYPFCRELLRPTTYLDAFETPMDSELQQAFFEINKEKFLGNQYLWLANVCKQKSILNIELCAQRHENIHSIDYEFPDLVKNDRLSAHEKVLYAYFTFALLDLSKNDMLRISIKNNWMFIMEMTWFCHRPRKGVKPCGVCTPCSIVVAEGFGWRISATTRRLANFKRIFYSGSHKLRKAIRTS